MPGNDETIRLILQTQGAEGLRKLADEAKAAAKEFENTGQAAEKVGKSSVNTGRSMLEFGRVIQDFTQGGFGGILNNIEGLARALGMGAGVAGAATIAGVALSLAGPKILEFFRTLGAEEAQLKPLKDRIEDVSKALGTLAEKQSLTNKEAAEFNRLAAEQGKLDKEAAENKARLAAMTKQPDKSGPTNKTIKDRVSAVAEGNQAAITAALNPELARLAGKEYMDLHGERMGVLARRNGPDGSGLTAAEKAELKGLESGYDAARGTSTVKAQQLLADAMAGKVDAAKKLVSLLPQGALRDQFVVAATSDQTRAEARATGAQFLDSTIGAATQGLRDRNQDAASARAAKENTLNIQEQMTEARRSQEAQNRAEKEAAEKETTRLREQAANEKARQEAKAERETARLREQAAKEAPKRAEAMQLAQFGQGIQQVAAENGVQLTPDQVMQGAKAAVDLAKQGVDTNTSIMSGFMDLVKSQMDLKNTLARQAAQMNAMRQQMGAMPVWSQTPDMWP